MGLTVTLVVLLGFWCVGSFSLPAPSGSYFMAFSGGTRLLVHAGDKPAQCDKNDHRHGNKTAGSTAAPSIQILSSVPFSQDPHSPLLLVCLLTGLISPVQDVLWWVDDTVATSVSSAGSEEDGAYSTSSVWEVSAADWRSRSTYWCGTIQEGRVYRRRFCSSDSGPCHSSPP